MSSPTPAPTPGCLSLVQRFQIPLLLIAVAAGFYFFGRWESSPSPTPSKDVISLEAEYKAAPHDYAILKADTSCSHLIWKTDPDVEQFAEPLADKYKAGFRSKDGKQGRFRITATGATRNWFSGATPHVADTVLVVVDAPIPPKPVPDPIPVPPTPSDPFFPTLQAAWQGEADPAKLTQRDALVSAYLQSSGYTQLDQYKTYKDWSDGMGNIIAGSNLKGRLPLVQRAIGTELDAKLPRTPATPVDKMLVVSQLNRLVNLLGSLK
jgi:hypothetical protein